MCGIKPQQQQLEAALLTMGLSFLTKMVEQAQLGNMPPSSDVLATATQAYRQGKITKTQYIAVIDALDEVSTVSQNAWVNHPKNQEYVTAHAFLDQFRR